MEDWQFQFINENLEKLVQLTKCNAALLHELQTEDVLDNDDLKALKKETDANGATSGVSKLYAMLQMRNGAYDALIQALQRTGQVAPANLLQNGRNTQSIQKEGAAHILLPKWDKLKSGTETPMVTVTSPCLKTKGKLGNSISVLAATIASSLFTSLFCAVYLIYYLSLSLLASIIISTAVGLFLLGLNLKVKFSRATVLLVAPELTARTARIAFVHLLMILSPLPHLQNNSEQFMASIVCTTERALNAARNNTEGVLRNSLGGVQGSLQTINELSNKIEKVISGPLDFFGDRVAEVENVIGEIGRMKEHCEKAKTGVTGACSEVLKLPGGACGGILSGRRKKRAFWDKIAKPFQDLGDKVSSGVGTAVDATRKGFQTGIDHTKRGVGTGTGAVRDGFQTGVNGVETGINTVRNGLNQACNSMKGLSSHCQQIRNVDICQPFGLIDSVRGKIAGFRHTATEGVKSMFRFKLEVNHGANSSVNEESFVEIKESFQEKVQSKIDFFLAFQRIWGMILSLSVVYLLVRKMLLVRKFVKDQPIKCKAVSIFFLLTNPFTLQVCFLFLIGTLDYSFFLIHQLFREVILENEIHLGVNFNASITPTGGEFGKVIVKGIIEVFELQKSVNTTVSFEECFKEEVEAPSVLTYLMAMGVSAVGIVTYGVDVYSRRRQKEMIQFAYGK